MTASEIKNKYKIPEHVLRIYESQVRGLFLDGQTGEDEYSDQELEKMSMVMTLGKFGFDDQEIGAFFLLEKRGKATKGARLDMLKRKRERILDEIHEREQTLDELDYIRYELR